MMMSSSPFFFVNVNIDSYVRFPVVHAFTFPLQGSEDFTSLSHASGNGWHC